MEGTQVYEWPATCCTCFRFATLPLLTETACWKSCRDVDTSPGAIGGKLSTEACQRAGQPALLSTDVTLLPLYEGLHMQGIFCCAVALLQSLVHKFQAFLEILRAQGSGLQPVKH